MTADRIVAAMLALCALGLAVGLVRDNHLTIVLTAFALGCGVSHLLSQAEARRRRPPVPPPTRGRKRK